LISDNLEARDGVEDEDEGCGIAGGGRGIVGFEMGR
jgi:hypothetical protein